MPRDCSERGQYCNTKQVEDLRCGLCTAWVQRQGQGRCQLCIVAVAGAHLDAISSQQYKHGERTKSPLNPPHALPPTCSA